MMGNTYSWKIILIFASLQWSATIDPVSAYLQTSVSGYLLSIPGFNDQEKRTQADAQTWCIRNQSKLLEITNDILQSSVVWFINNAINQNKMTGNNVIINAKRSSSDFTWVNGILKRSSLAVDGQSPGLSHSYGYLSSSQSGYGFIADTPTAPRGYICEGSSLCSDGFKLNGRCYKGSSETLSWFGARNRCLDGGGDLASFEFIVDTQGFGALNGSGWNQPTTYWVGLQRMKWTWQYSSSDARYSQWADGRPDYATNQNNECLCLRPYDWKWIECDCRQTYQFLCFTETESTRTSSPSSSTSMGTVYISSSTRITTRITTSTTTLQPANSSPSFSSTTTASSEGASAVTSASASASASAGVSSGVSASLSAGVSAGFSAGVSASVSAGVSAGVSASVSVGVSAGLGLADYELPVGLGVGLGGGVLIAAIIVILIVLVKRKGCHRKPGLEKPSSEPPDVTPESYYATVLPNQEYENIAMDIDISQIPPPIEYADLNIVAMSQSPYENEQICRSFV